MGWGPRGDASQAQHYPKPHPFNRPRDLGSREALQLIRACDLGWLLFLSAPHHTLQEVALIHQVFSIQLSPFNTEPCPLSSARESTETGPQGVRWPRQLTERD